MFLEDLFRAWDDAPPIRRIVAGYFGFKPKPKPSKKFHELLALFPGGIIR